MEKEKLFVQKLQETVQLARIQKNQLTEVQLEALFEELAIGEEKKRPVYEYLKQNRIRIGEEEDVEELSEEDRKYIDLYLEEIQSLAVSEEEKRAVILSAIAGDEDAQTALIENYLPEVAAIAKLYAGQGVLLEDLIGEGNIALMLGVKIVTCAETVEEAEGMIGKMIMDSMEAYINENLTLSEADKKIVNKINKIADSAKELAEELGRKITLEELVRETTFTEEQIREAIEITANNLECIEDSQDGNES